MDFRKKIILLTLFSLVLWADEEETFDMFFGDKPVPWFTGPLLTPSAHTVKMGRVKLQLFQDTTFTLASYDANWHVQSTPHLTMVDLRAQTKIGLYHRLDLQFTPRVLFQETNNVHATNVADLPFGLNVQILNPRNLSQGPSLKAIFRASAPLGKYERLSCPIYAMGTGSWFPGLGLSLSHLWYFQGPHYLEMRLASEMWFGTPVSLHGISAYGGTPQTRGTVYPGNFWYVSSSLEYSMTQRWHLACDFRYEHTLATRGILPQPSRICFSLAPALEYAWSREFGVLGGLWFSIAGRNAPRFVSSILSLVSHF